MMMTTDPTPSTSDDALAKAYNDAKVERRRLHDITDTPGWLRAYFEEAACAERYITALETVLSAATDENERLTELYRRSRILHKACWSMLAFCRRLVQPNMREEMDKILDALQEWNVLDTNILSDDAESSNEKE